MPTTRMRNRSARLARLGWLPVAASIAFALAGCVTVKPQQRAVLADPIMQFEGDPHASAQLRHALENREGAYGGSGVAAGGCGCN
jgi:hypothetical protein